MALYQSLYPKMGDPQVTMVVSIRSHGPMTKRTEELEMCHRLLRDIRAGKLPLVQVEIVLRKSQVWICPRSGEVLQYHEFEYVSMCFNTFWKHQRMDVS